MLLVGFSSGSMQDILSQKSVLGLINTNTGVADKQTVVDWIMLPVFRGLLSVVKVAESFSPIDSLSQGRSITWSSSGGLSVRSFCSWEEGWPRPGYSSSVVASWRRSKPPPDELPEPQVLQAAARPPAGLVAGRLGAHAKAARRLSGAGWNERPAPLERAPPLLALPPSPSAGFRRTRGRPLGSRQPVAAG